VMSSAPTATVSCMRKRGMRCDAAHASSMRTSWPRGAQRERPPFAVTPEAARPTGVAPYGAPEGGARRSSRHAPFLSGLLIGGSRRFVYERRGGEWINSAASQADWSALNLAI
jgi:hypothetical protein